MIVGIGIDTVNVKRMKHWMATPALVERYFHPAEIETISKKGGAGAVMSLAARFAAKEAFGKALGTGLKGIRLKDIRVVNDDYGKPDVFLHDTALEKFRASGGKKIFLSLTHETEHAIAMVIIEG